MGRPELPTLPWRCTLPLPPSANESKDIGYVGGQARIVPSNAVKAYKRDAGRLLIKQNPPIIPPHLPLILIFRFRFGSAAADWDNRCKLGQDVLFEQLGRPAPGATPTLSFDRKGQRKLVMPATGNDKYVTCAIVGKSVDRTNPGMDVCVRWGMAGIVDHIDAWLDSLPVGDYGLPRDLPPLDNREALRRALE
jgi:hypothetical protein